MVQKYSEKATSPKKQKEKRKKCNTTTVVHLRASAINHDLLQRMFDREKIKKIMKCNYYYTTVVSGFMSYESTV